MLEFAYPWLFLLLAAPLLVYRFLPPYKERKSSVQVPFFQHLVTLSGETPRPGAVILKRITFQKIWLGVSWLLLVTALARPEWVGDPIVHEKSARDLMVAVDLSGSMEARDFTREDGERTTRLAALKQVMSEFVSTREHDRLGLIVFGNSPYLQAPFTGDHETWLTLLDETEIGMAGQSTVFGDAIGLAIKMFEHSDRENRVLLVLTDGNDTGSRLPPVEAAKVAAARDIRIYTIAIGDPATTGEEALDLEVLERVAEITGGGYYQALDREQLAEVYAAIGRLEPELYETLTYRPRQSLHHYPFGILASVFLVFHTLMTVLALARRRAERHA